MTSFKEIYGEWLGAADLGGVARALTIERTEIGSVTDRQTQKEKPQLILHFTNVKKPYGCGIKNCRVIEGIFGTDQIESWVGKRIVLFPTREDVFGKQTDVIRIRSIEDEKIIRAIKQNQDNQGAARLGGVAPQANPAPLAPQPQSAPQHVSQYLPDRMRPDYVQTTVNEPRYVQDDLNDDPPPMGDDDLDDIPF